MKNLVLKTKKQRKKMLKMPLAFETPQNFNSMSNSKKNAAPSSKARKQAAPNSEARFSEARRQAVNTLEIRQLT